MPADDLRVDPIRFEVVGKPEPQGSAKAFVVQKKGAKPRAVITSDNPRLSSWRNAVAAAASAAMGGRELLRGPVRVDYFFGMPRPKNHFGRHGLLPSAPTFHTGRPDVDKLMRSVDDSLTATVVVDDAQICGGGFSKVYSDPPRTIVQVTRLMTGELPELGR